MKNNDIRQLLDSYVDGTCTAEEKAHVEMHYLYYLQQPEQEVPKIQELDKARIRNYKAISGRLRADASPKTIWSLWRWVGAAGVVLLVTGVLFLELGDKNHRVRLPAEETRYAAVDIVPGGNRAMLTFADGRVVELSDAQEGIIVGDSSINYQDGSSILDDRQQTIDNRHIDGKGSLTSNVSSLMSISTPRGGTYAVTLPDGSKVWLNASSTLKYPSRFDETERVVELEGEAYFEVRQQKIDNRQQTRNSIRSTVSRLTSHRPFRVMSKGQTVEVLGTTFNISAYPDEPETRTTLVSGLVQVTPSPAVLHPLLAGQVPQPSRTISLDDNPTGLTTQLHPGEQSILSPGGTFTKLQVNLEEFTAWKDGKFSFHMEPIEAVMRKIARWYDVEVVFQGDMSTHKFGGTISRFEQITQVLEKLEMTEQVRFKIEGRRIIVSK